MPRRLREPAEAKPHQVGVAAGAGLPLMRHAVEPLLTDATIEPGRPPKAFRPGGDRARQMDPLWNARYGIPGPP